MDYEKFIDQYLTKYEYIDTGAGNINLNMIIHTVFNDKHKKVIRHPYCLICILNNNEEIIKISKISLIEPKYIYIRNLFKKPKFDLLTDEELDTFINIMNSGDSYKDILHRMNHNYSISENKYWKELDIDREIPDYNTLKGKNKIHEIII